MSLSKLTVAISGFSGTSIAEPGGSVASALRKTFGNRIKIIALAYSALTHSIYSPGLVDEIYLIQPLTDIGNHYLDLARVFNLCKPNIYIPTLELEVKYFRYFVNRFRDMGPKTLIPEIIHFDRVSKLGLHYFCNDHQVLYPKTIVTHNSDEFHYSINRSVFPCLIKSSLNGAATVNNLYEANIAAQKFSNFWQHPILIQEYIDGDQYMVASLLNEENKVIKTIYARKHLVNQFGKSAITVMVDQPALKAVASRILETLDWSGPLELEFIKTGDKYYLFEINPRFPSWIDISSSLENNLPALLVNHLRGKRSRNVSQNNYDDVLLRATDEACVSMHDFYQLQKKGILQNFTDHAVRSNASQNLHDTWIAITGVSSLYLPMPGLSVAKALKQHYSSLFNLMCFSESYQDTGCYRSDLFDRVVQIDMNVSSKALLQQIITLCKKTPLKAIIPTLDRHIEIFIAIEKDLDKLGIKMLLPGSKNLNKVYQFPNKEFVGTNIQAPESWVIKNMNDVPTIIEKTGYPVVLKTLGPKKSCINIAYSSATLESLYAMMSSQKQTIYLLQQYIEGEHFSIFGLASKESELLFGVVIKAMQTCIYGKIWMASQIEEPAATPFLNVLSTLIRELQWRGPIEIDCIRDKYDELIYCIDINPRFPAWTYYATVVEPDLLKTYLESLLDIKIKNNKQQKKECLYIRLPRNYYSNLNILGKLISAQGIEYDA